MSDPHSPTRARDSLPPAVSFAPKAYGIWFNPSRPKIVAFFGFVCLAIGYVGFVMKGAGLPALFMDMKWLNPNYKPIPYNRVQFTVTVFIVLIDLLIHLVCIAGAIGTLKMRHWGRKTLIAYAVGGIVFTLLKTAWQISMFDFMIDYQLSTTTQPVDHQQMQNQQFFALIVMTIVQLLWLGLVIVLLTNRYIRGRFDDSENGVLVIADEWQSRSV